MSKKERIEEAENKLRELNKSLQYVTTEIAKYEKEIEELNNKIFGEHYFTREEGNNYAGATYYNFSIEINNRRYSEEAQSYFKGFKITDEDTIYLAHNIDKYDMRNLRRYLHPDSYELLELYLNMKKHGKL